MKPFDKEQSHWLEDHLASMAIYFALEERSNKRMKEKISEMLKEVRKDVVAEKDNIDSNSNPDGRMRGNQGNDPKDQ